MAGAPSRGFVISTKALTLVFGAARLAVFASGDQTSAVLRDLFQANVLALLLRERFISTELVERMREWRHSGFHAYAGEGIPDIEDALRGETG